MSKKRKEPKSTRAVRVEEEAAPELLVNRSGVKHPGFRSEDATKRSSTFHAAVSVRPRTVSDTQSLPTPTPRCFVSRRSYKQCGPPETSAPRRTIGPCQRGDSTTSTRVLQADRDDAIGGVCEAQILAAEGGARRGARRDAHVAERAPQGQGGAAEDAVATPRAAAVGDDRPGAPIFGTPERRGAVQNSRLVRESQNLQEPIRTLDAQRDAALHDTLDEQNEKESHSGQGEPQRPRRAAAAKTRIRKGAVTGNGNAKRLGGEVSE
eukprot:scaffold482_cov247-Pinguiococcus_pyrenoidosus.AAC.22